MSSPLEEEVQKLAAEFTGRMVAIYKSAHDGVAGLDYFEMSETAMDKLFD